MRAPAPGAGDRGAEAVAAAVLRRFRGAPVADRLHVAVRHRLFPFPALLRLAPAAGRAVDLGCGHGLWSLMLAEARPGLQVLGIDPDAGKVARAQAAAGDAANLRFAVGRAEDVPALACDLVSLIDVLYLLPPAQQERVLRAAAAGLRPGGRLLVKEMSERPRWKFLWNQAQELLSVRVLRVTQGRSFHFRTEADWRRLLEGLGLQVRSERLDRGYLHPHLLLEGTRPGP